MHDIDNHVLAMRIRNATISLEVVLEQAKAAVSSPLMQRYYECFPESVIDSTVLQQRLNCGWAIDWKNGCLFHPRVGTPEPELLYANDDLEEDVHATSASVGELKEAGIRFQMREEETDFIMEEVKGYQREWVGYLQSVQNIGQAFKLHLPSEPRGVRVHTQTDTETELLEPLTEGEALLFIASVKGPPKAAFADELQWWEAAKSFIIKWGQCLDAQGIMFRDKRLAAMLQVCVDIAQDRIDEVNYHNWMHQEVWPNTGAPVGEQRNAFTELGVDAQLFRRARASARRDNVGGSASHCNRWFFSERDGVTHGRETENDLLYTKSEQWQTPLERCDGQYMHHVEANYIYELPRDAHCAWFSSMYTYWQRDANGELVEARAADNGPINRGWADRSVYLLRQSMKRDENFARKLWKTLTWPLPLVETMFPRVETEYRESIKAAAPGPLHRRRAQLSWRELQDIVAFGWYDDQREWFNVPAYGLEALSILNHLPNPGVLHGSLVHKLIRFTRCESWHKTTLSREHLNALREALDWRRKNTHRASLPLNYVVQQYRK